MKYILDSICALQEYMELDIWILQAKLREGKKNAVKNTLHIILWY